MAQTAERKWFADQQPEVPVCRAGAENGILRSQADQALSPQLTNGLQVRIVIGRQFSALILKETTQQLGAIELTAGAVSESRQRTCPGKERIQPNKKTQTTERPLHMRQPKSIPLPAPCVQIHRRRNTFLCE